MKLALAILSAGNIALGQLPQTVLPPAPTLVPVNAPEVQPITQPTIPGTLRAQGIGAGKLTLENWKTDWGSYDRDYIRQHHVAVTVFSWAKVDTEARLEALWFGRELKEHGDRVLLNWSSDPIVLRPGAAPQTFILHSGNVAGAVERYVALGERYAAGHKIEGWQCRLVVNGTPISDAASATYLLELARDHIRLGTLKDLSPKRR